MMERIKGVMGQEYEVLDVTKLQAEQRYEVFDAEKAQLEAWGQRLKQGRDEAEKDLLVARLQSEVDGKDRTVKMLIQLIERYGFCKPEMQLGRMELQEAQDRWMCEVGIDDKNLGAFAQYVLRDTKKLGEL